MESLLGQIVRAEEHNGTIFLQYASGKIIQLFSWHGSVGLLLTVDPQKEEIRNG